MHTTTPALLCGGDKGQIAVTCALVATNGDRTVKTDWLYVRANSMQRFHVIMHALYTSVYLKRLRVYTISVYEKMGDMKAS